MLADLALRRYRRQLEARLRRLARVGLVPLADPDDLGEPAEESSEPPAGGAVVLRLERPAGAKRRETRRLRLPEGP